MSKTLALAINAIAIVCCFLAAITATEAWKTIFFLLLMAANMGMFALNWME